MHVKQLVTEQAAQVVFVELSINVALQALQVVKEEQVKQFVTVQVVQVVLVALKKIANYRHCK